VISVNDSVNLQTPVLTIILTLLLVIVLFLLIIFGNLGSSIIVAVLTVIIGVITFVLGQIAIKFFIEPVQRQQELIGEIAHNIIYYADIWDNPGAASEEKNYEAAEIFRQYAGQLRALTNLINGYSYFSQLGFVPSFRKINEAATGLTGLSNSIKRITSERYGGKLGRSEFQRLCSGGSVKNREYINTIENNLDIKMGLGIFED